MRLATILLFSALAAAFSALPVAAQNNPVPQVVGPPHPQAVVPGGGDFTLKVYGANFVPGAVVNWNRQARATTYISGHEVDGTILASDIVSNTAGYITVTNPPPGGGVSSSSWSLVEVHEPTAALVPGSPIVTLGSVQPASLLVADFNNDGIPDLAGGDRIIQVNLGNGNGTFRFGSNATYVAYDTSASNVTAYGDFNGDGNLDLAYGAGFGVHVTSTGMGVSLGNGNGTFDHGWEFTDTGSLLESEVAAGDLNRDGKLDLLAGDCCITSVFLGNGDGTFQLTTTYTGEGGVNMVLGDFNGDGILDAVYYGDTAPITLALGNGDGTFQTPVTIATPSGGCHSGPPMLISDFNGDGSLDVAFCDGSRIGILLGNGDGTFQPPQYYYVNSDPAGDFTFAAGDFNSDGNTDLIVSNYTNGHLDILLGNGDGTFQPETRVKLGSRLNGAELGIVTGDFNSDGLLDFVFQFSGISVAVYLQE